ncbi:MAG: hypothetical protein ACOYK9_00740 [Chlamydiia bacterium]
MKYEDLPLELQNPWLTGPLLTPSAKITPKGHISIQPYVLFSNVYGHFNNHWKIETVDTSHNINFQTFISYGLSKWLDVTIMGQFHTNFKNGQSQTGLGDAYLGFDFQLLNENPNGYQPAVKLFILESFPTGTYNNLNPRLRHTDATGDGSFGTKIGFAVGKTYHVKDYIWITTRYSLAYFLFTPVEVENYNTYGGGINTRGTIYRQGSFPVSLGMEITFSRNFALACDLLSLLSGPNTFKGNLGVDSDGFPASVGGKQIYQLSLAPAMEWNFSPNFGIVAGVWFSIYGKNSESFQSGVLSFNIYK